MRRCRKNGQSEAVVHAAALQDHFARLLRISNASQPPSTTPGATLTLAQRCGLIAKPEPLLTKEQWSTVHAASRHRGDSSHDCPICQDSFKDEEQVLLSCSHVFHRTCLNRFERSCGQPTCPICRASQYQKRKIADGSDAYKQDCATRIQAAARGYLVRKWYKKLWKSKPPRNGRLRRRWCADWISEHTDKIAQNTDEQWDNVDKLFEDIDKSLHETHKIHEIAARRVQRLTGEEPEHLSDPALFDIDPFDVFREGGTHISRSVAERPGARSNNSAIVPVISDGTSNWDRTLDRALDRGETQCAICLGNLDEMTSTQGGESNAWLSCSHVFHSKCIADHEHSLNTKGVSPSCPVCRADYAKKLL